MAGIKYYRLFFKSFLDFLALVLLAVTGWPVAKTANLEEQELSELPSLIDRLRLAHGSLLFSRIGT